MFETSERVSFGFCEHVMFITEASLSCLSFCTSANSLMEITSQRYKIERVLVLHPPLWLGLLATVIIPMMMITVMIMIQAFI